MHVTAGEAKHKDDLEPSDDVPTTTRGRTSVSNLIRLISDEHRLNRGDSSLPGFRAMAMYRFGVWAKATDRSSLLRRLRGRVLDVFYIIAHRYVRNHYGIEVHRTAEIGRGVRFAHQGGIVIHHYARIGDGCLIRHGVTLGNAGRGVTPDQAPILERNVSVGAGAMILGKVTIGEGAKIGPNVVIYTDIPPGATVVATAPRILQAPKTQQASSVEPGDDG